MAVPNLTFLPCRNDSRLVGLTASQLASQTTETSQPKRASRSQLKPCCCALLLLLLQQQHRHMVSCEMITCPSQVQSPEFIRQVKNNSYIHILSRTPFLHRMFNRRSYRLPRNPDLRRDSPIPASVPPRFPNFCPFSGKQAPRFLNLNL
jgi:hypothetical protein